MKTYTIFPKAPALLLGLACLAARPSCCRADCDTYSANLDYADQEGLDYRVWDGQGVLERWASGINWEGNDAPVAGTHLFFPVNGVLGSATENNLPAGTRIGSIHICNDKGVFGADAFDGWTHRGNRIMLEGPLRVFGNTQWLNGPSVCRVEFPITMIQGGLAHSIAADGSALLVCTGPVLLNTGTRSVGFGNAEMEGVISGTAPVSLSDYGRLSAANTFTGAVTVTSGADWTIAHQNGLGSGPAGTFFMIGNNVAGAIHWTAAVCPELFQLWGGELYFDAPGGVTHTSNIELGGPYDPAIHSAGPTTLAQPLKRIVNLPFTPTVDPAPLRVHLYGDGSGSLTLAGDASSIPSGDAFGGAIYNEKGLVVFNVNGGLAGTGALFVSGGEEAHPVAPATLRWLRSDQVPPTAELRADEAGLIDLHGNNQTAAKLVMRNGDVATGAGMLTLSGRGRAQPLGSWPCFAGLCVQRQSAPQFHLAA